jgi:hypothetical protein
MNRSRNRIWKYSRRPPEQRLGSLRILSVDVGEMTVSSLEGTPAKDGCCGHYRIGEV